MTIKECIDIVDNIKPNQYTVREKVMWLSFLDKVIIDDVLKTHEGYDGRYDSFEGYTEDKLSVTLIVPSPYDEVYTAYLKMKIDGENGETAKYNNSMVLYNTYMLKYRKYYNKTHMPLGNGKSELSKACVNQVGLSDAEYENLKRDLTFILTEYFGDAVSEDKLYGIVTSYVQNNSEMLKGKDGHTPIKGVDYWNDIDKAEFLGYADEKANETLAESKRYANNKVMNESLSIGMRISILDEKHTNYTNQEVIEAEIRAKENDAETLAESKAYTDENAVLRVRKGEGWLEGVHGFTKIILPGHDLNGEPWGNSFYVALTDFTAQWMAFTEPGKTLIFDITNKESNTVIVVDESTGEETTIQDSWGVLTNMERCVQIGSDLGCTFYYYDETWATVLGAEERAKEYTNGQIDAIGTDLVNLREYTDEKIGDIDAALDRIIELQNGLLGVSE